MQRFWGIVLMGGSVRYLRPAALAGSQPGKVDSLQGPVLQDRPDTFCHKRFCAWLARNEVAPRLCIQLLAQIFTVIYFAFFILMPWYSKIDKTKPEPKRLTE